LINTMLKVNLKIYLENIKILMINLLKNFWFLQEKMFTICSTMK